MLHQVNGKNLTSKETMAVSQDCPKFIGSPVTCSSQRDKETLLPLWEFYSILMFESILVY